MSLITDKQVEQFYEEGYFLTEPMFSDEKLAAVTQAFDELHAKAIEEAKAQNNPRALELATYRPFIGQAHTRSDVLKAFVKEPIYLEACAKFIGDDADLYYNQVVIKPPEKGMSFAWHQDSGYKNTKPLEYITCWTAISRTFVDNGCIWVIPGSHKRGLIEHRRDEADSSMKPLIDNEDGAIPVEMKPGQIAIFSSLTLHKSGPNVSREIRRGYVPQYHVPNVVGMDDQRWGDQFPVLRGGKAV